MSHEKPRLWTGICAEFTLMKRALFFFITVLNIQNGPSQVVISSDFDRGSIGALKENSTNNFTGKTKHWLKADGIGDQYYWFY